MLRTARSTLAGTSFHTGGAQHVLCCRRTSSQATEDVNQAVPLIAPRLDYRALLSDLPTILSNAKTRNAATSPEQIQTAATLAQARVDLNTQLNQLQKERGIVGERVRKREEGAKEEAQRIKDEIHQLSPKVTEVEAKLLAAALPIPNTTHPEVPVGPEENAVTLETLGPTPIAADPNRDHLLVARALGIVDFESGAIVTGSGWYFLRGAGVVLEAALQSYALSVAVSRGFTPVACPDVVRADIAGRCGFSPRERDGTSQSYHISSSTPGSPQLSLAATAEIPLAGSFFGRNCYHQELPLKVVGVGKAYRTETGKGSDVRGLYRVHQFSKVELFTVCDQDSSEKEMEAIKDVQREMVQGLGLSVRVLEMPTEELGAAAHRKVDMEAWMPGRGNWGEISSTSNCTSYQARRLHITYRTPQAAPSDNPHAPPPPKVAPTSFAHTLNGTAAAIPRLIVALLENGVVLSQGTAADAKPAKAKSDRKKRVTKKTEGDRKESFDEGLVVSGMRLPKVLQRFWLGEEKIGHIPIEWI